MANKFADDLTPSSAKNVPITFRTDKETSVVLKNLANLNGKKRSAFIDFLVQISLKTFQENS